VTASNDYELERRTRELHALTEIAKTLSVPLELFQLLGAVMGKITNVLEPAELGLVMLWDEPSGVFRPEAAFGYDLSQMSEVGLRAGEGVTGKVHDEGKARLLNAPDEIAEAMSDQNFAAQRIGRAAPRGRPQIRHAHDRDLESPGPVHGERSALRADARRSHRDGD
jgi:hypothetical protein